MEDNKDTQETQETQETADNSQDGSGMGCLFDLLYQLFAEVVFSVLFVAMWPGAVVGILGAVVFIWLGGWHAWPWAVGLMVVIWAGIGVPFMLRPNAPPRPRREKRDSTSDGE